MNKNNVKSIISKIVPKELVRFIKNSLPFWNEYPLKSYSQEGEDMILRRIFENVDKGFYVDVGAHHPKRFSNTYFFYKRGWSGINIDATPGSMDLFKIMRTRDTNIEAAISDEEKEVTLFLYNEPALNTLSQDQTLTIKNKDYHIVETKTIKTISLKALLEKTLPKNKKITFLSVDVEGLDLEVLRSNDWRIFRPEVILIEQTNTLLEDIKNTDSYKFLKSQDYMLLAKSLNTLIFQDNLFSHKINKKYNNV